MRVVLGPPPRQITRRSDFKGNRTSHVWIPRIFMIPHTLVGLGLLVATLYLFAAIVGGTSYKGAITSREGCHQGKKSTTCKVTYEYFVDETSHTNYTSMSVDAYEKTLVGQPIAVRVLSIAPLIFPLPVIDGKHQGSIFFLPLFAIIWNLLVGTFNYFLWYLPWLEKKLVREGVSVPGVLTAVSKFGHKDGSRKVFFEFTPNQEHATGANDQMSTGIAAGRVKGKMLVGAEFFVMGQLKVGDKITVLYDPQRVSRNVIYEFSMHQETNGA